MKTNFNSHELISVSVSSALQVSPAACPTCKGAGYTRQDLPFGHPKFGKPQPCKCLIREREAKARAKMRELSGIDSLYAYRDASFSSYRPADATGRAARAQCMAFSEDPFFWLLMTGSNGCGKTHLAVSIARKILEIGEKSVLFQAVPDLLDYLKAGFGNESESYDKRLGEIRNVDVLILDDLGAEKSTPWAEEKLFQILNHRINRWLPTVFTTNLRWQNERFETRSGAGIDERISSRLSDVRVAKIDMWALADQRTVERR